MMVQSSAIVGFILLLGLGFFFGLAFEEFHGEVAQARPGGVRTFPLLALAGALLFKLDTTRLLPLSIGLLALSIWLTCYYWHHVGEIDPEGRRNVGLMVPVCNVLAYLLGPIALAEPPWMAIGVTVAAVLLLTARETLHGLARRIPMQEFITAGKFLILTGLVLPFLPNEPVTHLTEITPHQVWLAVIAVCTVSYASYLLQRYVAPPGALLWVALLGGIYSSTATTVILARRACSEPALSREAQTGIMLATSMMYLRLLLIVAIFDLALARALAPMLLPLAMGGLALAGLWHRLGGSATVSRAADAKPTNPLELTAAFIFAALFVVISLATAWAHGEFGQSGLFGLAAIVGFADIDPFVLSIAAGGAAPLSTAASAVAILIAASSNNVLKATYALAFAGGRGAFAPAAVLAFLALIGAAVSWWTTTAMAH